MKITIKRVFSVITWLLVAHGALRLFNVLFAGRELTWGESIAFSIAIMMVLASAAIRSWREEPWGVIFGPPPLIEKEKE